MKNVLLRGAIWISAYNQEYYLNKKLMTMKKLIILLAIITMAFNMNAQLSMSFQASTKYQKTTFGYKIGKTQPYIGLGFLSYGGSAESFDFDHEKYTTKGYVRVIMPNLGVKYTLLSKDSLKVGVDFGIYKPFISGKMEDDGEEIKEFSDNLKKIHVFGGELGLFTEYFFNNHFSIGGEFGFRFANSNFKQKDEFDDYKFNAHLGMTYTTVSASFYF